MYCSCCWRRSLYWRDIDGAASIAIPLVLLAFIYFSIERFGNAFPHVCWVRGDGASSRLMEERFQNIAPITYMCYIPT